VIGPSTAAAPAWGGDVLKTSPWSWKNPKLGLLCNSVKTQNRKVKICSVLKIRNRRDNFKDMQFFNFKNRALYHFIENTLHQ